MEKDSLEAELYQLDQLNAQLEKRTAMLEVENKELLDKREQLQSKSLLLLLLLLQHSYTVMGMCENLY